MVYFELIRWMNEHAAVRQDSQWVNMKCNAHGRATVKGFLALVVYKGMYKVPWSYIFGGSFNHGCDFVSQILPRRVFWRIFRHIRFGPTQPQGGPSHPYSSFLAGISILRANSRELWKLGKGTYYENVLELELTRIVELSQKIYQYMCDMSEY